MCNISYVHYFKQTPPTGYVDACTGIISSTSSSVTMETVNILPGETYKITLTVSALGRTSGTFDVEVYTCNTSQIDGFEWRKF